MEVFDIPGVLEVGLSDILLGWNHYVFDVIDTACHCAQWV